jgi:four helix bundle protein
LKKAEGRRQRAVQLSINCYKFTRLFPQSELYGLTSQIRRSSVSVASNIAEGYGRRSKPEYIQFLHIALGSLRELDTQLIIAKEVDLAEKNLFTPLLSEVEEMQSISGLTYEQETFVQDSIPVRLGKLVTNLARINQLFSDSTHEDVVKSLIRETMYFLEWIAPDIDIDNAFELANLGRFLTRWLFNWEPAWNNTDAKNQIIQELGIWSDSVLQMSKLPAVQQS